MSDARRDPDELLRHVQEEERRALRGKLVVFFGGAAGVGKTYAMLEAARSERDLKRDVVIGVVETHGRYETGALVIGLPLLPRTKIEYKGVSVHEFDLDGALARRPGLILMDELAHTNAPGMRHAKRWQDVEELLDAGIDVYTTLNVQHIESLNDVVAQVTGVIVRETVPDRILEEASEVRLIDLPPDELLERLAEGKVYLPDQAQHAVQNFFRKGNLIALRELALRATAARVDAQMRNYRTEHGIQRVWPTGDRILVGVSPSPTSTRLLRAARRMATSLHAEWIAVNVEAAASVRLDGASRRRAAENLRLAEQLGAETVTLHGQSAADAMLTYARAHNVTKIVVGKPTHARWRDLFGPSFLDQMIRSSGDIDIYVISGDETEGRSLPTAEQPARAPPIEYGTYALSVAVPAIATCVCWWTFLRAQLADVVMVYLLGIIIVAMRFGYGPSIASAVLSVALLDFFFVPPIFSFSVSDLQHVVTFAVMFVVALVISSLTARIRDQVSAARQREQRMASLYGLTRELARTPMTRNLAGVAVRHLSEMFDAEIALFLEAGDGSLSNAATAHAGGIAPEGRVFEPEPKERGVVEWVWAHDKSAGLGTDTLPSSSALYVPLRETRGKVGVLGLRPTDVHRFVDPEQRAQLDVFATQVASALERARLAEEAQRTQLQMQTERLRSSLLSSVSHDLRTPLAVITGAASALAETQPEVGPEVRHELSETIHEEAQRLNRLVRNLLDMTKITSGAIKVTKEWQPLEEVIGAVLDRMTELLSGRNVDVKLPKDLPLVPIDAILIEQVFINILENAAKYTPKGSPIEISAKHELIGASGSREPEAVVVTVADRGPGVPKEHIDEIFDKFYRLPREGEGGGAGLGLAICRGIVETHGGRIWAENREEAGAAFRFTIPIEGTPPSIALGEEPA
jgi:two-component system, OmpR family, sensor histidine kinase KdpD